jgi:hypothetical protein
MVSKLSSAQSSSIVTSYLVWWGITLTISITNRYTAVKIHFMRKILGFTMMGAVVFSVNDQDTRCKMLRITAITAFIQGEAGIQKPECALTKQTYLKKSIL